MNQTAFPFPCVIDLGLLEIQVGRNCVVLKRKDREYPHVTLFYDPRPGCSYWWPHITYRDRGGRVRREELTRWRSEHGAELNRRFRAFAGPRLQALLRPVDLEQLSADDWLAVIPSEKLLAQFIDIMLVEPRLLAIEKLGDMFKNNERNGSLIECLFDDCVRPVALEVPGCYGILRISDDVVEDGLLYGVNFGDPRIAWFIAPSVLLGMNPVELLRTVMPEALAKFDRIAEVLELPFDRGLLHATATI